MKFLSSLLLVFLIIQQPLYALENDPNKMKVLQCMAVYDFDFVAEELGFTVAQVTANGKEEPRLTEAQADRRRFDQAARFFTTGKLNSRLSAKEKKISIGKDLAQRCKIIAETVMEVMALKGQLLETNQKSGPAPLEQSF
jgi:hypothetical protein